MQLMQPQPKAVYQYRTLHPRRCINTVPYTLYTHGDVSIHIHHDQWSARQ